jgi:poly(hydroxyalkanoate) depolymerase family esterase
MSRILCPIVLLCIALSVVACSDSEDYPGLTGVGNFGDNPGDLDMFLFEPSSPTVDMPLVIALHGCSQNAGDMAELTEWNKLAETYGFYVVYPEQSAGNNVSSCFNWFQTKDINKGSGESKSIYSMVEYMVGHYSINPQRVYITGLSAGAAMTTVMLANYPDKFAAGAIFGGGPARGATDVWSSISALAGDVTKSPEEWGALARSQYISYTGSYPPLCIFHGTNDNVVSPVNATEAAKQWTNLHGTDDVADESISGFEGAADVQRVVYKTTSGYEAVVRYIINDMGHAIPVYSGACRNQGGSSSTFATEKNFFSTYWTAVFFGIIPPAAVNGSALVSAGQDSLTYSVPAYNGSTYAWQLPEGCTITSGDGTATITVTWGTTGGLVSAIETDANGCTYPCTGVMVGF